MRSIAKARFKILCTKFSNPHKFVIINSEGIELLGTGVALGGGGEHFSSSSKNFDLDNKEH